MTGYVSTRYYRAPEIMLTWQKYDVEVDIWSAGCIFAEMLEGKPLFPGKDHVNQFSIITELLGTPPDDVIQTICSENVSFSALSAAEMYEKSTNSHGYRLCDLSSPSRSVNANRWRISSGMPMRMVRDTGFFCNLCMGADNLQPWTCLSECWCSTPRSEFVPEKRWHTSTLRRTMTLPTSRSRKRSSTGRSTTPICPWTPGRS